MSTDRYFRNLLMNDIEKMSKEKQSKKHSILEDFASRGFNQSSINPYMLWKVDKEFIENALKKWVEVKKRVILEKNINMGTEMKLELGSDIDKFLDEHLKRAIAENEEWKRKVPSAPGIERQIKTDSVLLDILAKRQFEILVDSLPSESVTTSGTFKGEVETMKEYPNGVVNNSQKTDDYDVFISHASEDKDSFVRPLAEKLFNKGIRVWYDEFSLKVGDSLRESIDMGLKKSCHGIVVFSPDFFNKDWPQKELNGLVAIETSGQNVILPIWHNIDKSDILKYSPILADRVAIKSSLPIEQIVTKLLDVIQPKDKYTALLHSTMSKWASHGIIPSVDELYLFSENIKIDSLAINDLAFLCCSYVARDDDMLNWTESGKPFFYFKGMSERMRQLANFNESILSSFQLKFIQGGGIGSHYHKVIYKSLMSAEVVLHDNNGILMAFYCVIRGINEINFEILMIRGDVVRSYVRHIDNLSHNDFKDYYHKMIEMESI